MESGLDVEWIVKNFGFEIYVNFVSFSFILGLARNITKMISECGPKFEFDGTQRLVEFIIDVHPLNC